MRIEAPLTLIRRIDLPLPLSFGKIKWPERLRVFRALEALVVKEKDWENSPIQPFTISAAIWTLWQKSSCRKRLPSDGQFA